MTKESNVVRMCDHKCAQGRNHDCELPIEEYPPASARNAVIAVVVALLAVLYSIWARA